MEVLKDILYLQNKELLTRMADDLYIDKEQREDFIRKYLKKNYCIITKTNKDNTKLHIKNIIYCVK